MKKSESRVVFVTARGKKVTITFIHTDNYTVRAEVVAENTPGQINCIRNSEDDWVILSDSLDRVQLFDGYPPAAMNIDLEQVYQNYLTEMFVT